MALNYRIGKSGVIELVSPDGTIMTRHSSTECIAIFHDDGVLLKHGSLEMVCGFRSRMEAFLEADLVSGYETIEIQGVEFADPRILEEINLVLNCAGRAKGLSARLKEIAQARQPEQPEQGFGPC